MNCFNIPIDNAATQKPTFQDMVFTCKKNNMKFKRSRRNYYVSIVFQSNRKSALLTAAKKARLKNNPARVRFAEAVTVNGAPVITVSNLQSALISTE